MLTKAFVWCFLIGTCSIYSVLTDEATLSDKVQQLTDWSLKKSVIRLNNERFKHFVRTSPRNYSMIVMLTALGPQRQCGVCKQAHDEFELVAQSYRFSSAFSNKLFFAMVDFDEGAEVFQYLKLNSAPVFIHFPAKAKPKKGDQMDMNRRGFSADQIAKWVQDRTEIHVEIYRPPNYSGFVLILFSVIMMGGLLYLKRDSLTFLYNNLVWGVFVILVILLCTSGQVWNNIRGSTFVNHDRKTGQTGVVCYFISGQTWNLINGPPFMSTRKDAPEIFANDSQSQYVAETYIEYVSRSSGHQYIMETYIVFLLYFGVCVGMILLNEAPKIKSRTGKRKTVVAIVGIIIVIVLFSFILSVFRAKYQGYPYSFLIK